MTGDRILLVDDEREVGAAALRDLRAWCRQEKTTAVSVASAQEALDEMELTKGGYAVVVTDLRMPEMMGNVLVRHISERWPDTVNIVLTGTVELDFVQDFLDSCVYSFIRKPWIREQLVSDISTALQLHHYKRRGRDGLDASCTEPLPGQHPRERAGKHELPEDPRLGIDAHRESGAACDFPGSFLEVKRLDEDRILFVLADVFGKGLQAAFVMSLLGTIMDVDLALVFENRPLSPTSFAEWIHRRIFGLLKTVDGLSVALVVMEVDLGRDLCRWVNVGQPSSAVLPDTGPVARGAVDPATRIDGDRTYREEVLAFPAGSRLVLSNHGLARSGEDEDARDVGEYCELVLACLSEGRDAEETGRRLRERSGSGASGDDLTLVRLHRP